MTKEEFEESLKVEGETLWQAFEELEAEGFFEEMKRKYGLSSPVSSRQSSPTHPIAGSVERVASESSGRND
jgi:hypothetical protein